MGKKSILENESTILDRKVYFCLHRNNSPSDDSYYLRICERKERTGLEQLTQKELLQVEELLGIEALAVRKCELYREKCKDDEVVQLLSDAMQMHQSHIDQLMEILRQHNGQESYSH